MGSTSSSCLVFDNGLLGEKISRGSIVALHSLRALEAGRSTRLQLLVSGISHVLYLSIKDCYDRS